MVGELRIMADTNQIITWVSGPVGVLTGCLISLYVKDQTRKVAQTEFAIMIDSALTAFQIKLEATLNGTYRRVPECILMEEGSNRRLATLEGRMDAMVTPGKGIKGTCATCHR